LDNKVEKGGAAIVMDPKTGEILAMAVKPDFDLNAPFTLKPEVQAEVDKLDSTTKKERIGQEVSKMWRNKAIVDSYEPGSTFKIITSAMGLEENMITPETTFNCAGAYTVAGRAIKCWRYYRPHGLQTFKQGVQNSCNPVFIDIGLRAGADIFYNYVKGFGFLERTGIDFDGETQGIFHQKKNMHELEVATASFGQGFQVTPLQMIAAASAVANGGKLLKPHLVKQIVDVEGNTIKNVEPEMVRQVISQQTCDILKPVLESVVSEGTAQNAFISGFRVGGKTGTSEKLPRGQNNYIASFVGMAPCNDPRVVVILVLDEPKGKDYYGGIIAAPVVGKIMDDVLRYLEVEPQYNDSELSKLEVGVPQAVGADVSEAKSRMTEAKLTAKIIGNGKTVLEQTPKAGVKILEKSQVLLYTEAAQAKANVTIPNLTGKSVLDATKALNAIGLNIRVSGAGQVTKQDPPAGSTVVVGSIVAVDFRAQSQEVGVE
ncbi:MAG: PASTA domain-containing protein, partial [Hyphomonadaceae bacterium]|nr:PASTA domain-containing protein [Clostridia bacterium]